MKIKKVEIQAFRAYDKAEHGTFDFKIKEGEQYADFISLYAPNGFGKTSFYDAIEYSYTNNIDRLLKNSNNKGIAKSEKNLKDKNKQFILRNRKSNSELNSYVKLFTTDSKEPIIKEIKEPRLGGSDFKFDDKLTKNKYFQEVILSQDWISGFLKEDKPEDRYETFIKYFGNKELDEYHKNLSLLINQNEKEIKKLTTELNGVQLELNFDGDHEILLKINQKINELNSKANLFQSIDQQTSETDILNLSNSISERLNTIQFENKENQKLILNLGELITGNDKHLSYQQFQIKLEELARFMNRKEELVFILNQFKDFKKKSIELNSIKENNKQVLKEKKYKEKILSLFNKYEEVLELIKKKNEDVRQLDNDNNILNKKIEDQKIEESTLNIQVENIQKEIENLTSTINELPSIKADILSTKDRVKILSNERNTKLKDLETLTDKIQLLDFEILDFKEALKNIEEDIFPSEFDKNFENYSNLLSHRKKLKKKLEEEDKKLKEKNKKFSDQNNFQKELEKFIEKGLSIINNKKENTCPLCTQEYDSYNNLADKVTNNPLLSQRSISLLNDINEIENTINSTSKDLEKVTLDITKTIQQDISKRVSKLNDLKKEKFEIDREKIELENKFEKFSKHLTKLNSLISNKTIEEYEKWAKEQKDKLSKREQGFLENLSKIKEKLNKDGEQSLIIKEKIMLLRKEIEELNKREEFNKVKEFYLENYPNNDVDSKFIQTDLDRLSIDIEKNSNKINVLKEEIKNLEKELLTKDESISEKELNNLQESIDKLSKQLNIYKDHVKLVSNIDLNISKKESFVNDINKLKESKKNIININLEEEKSLDLLSKLKDNVIPYLKFKEFKEKEEGIKSRIKFLNSKVKKNLTEEKVKVSEYLEKQIKSFFFEDLINDLYKRIDPHPDYKKVKFIPDFKDSKPKLNVCVYQEKDNTNFIIPNLYFSQAQLNILSLCIFLAKALNAKDDDDKPIECIFIDDPIQSMDSINILSTIDLLRSIVVNQKKQIILSTHDENFHNLLKKKIPSNLFKSKFMELETFGKVKRE